MKKIFLLFSFLYFFTVVFFANNAFAEEPVLRVLIKDYVPSVSIKSTGGIAFYTNPKDPKTFDSLDAVLQADRDYIKVNINGQDFLEFRQAVFFKPVKKSYLIIDGNKYSGIIQIAKREKLLRVINHINLEEYLLGVIPQELKTKHAEALKAQAVASRTYAYARIKNSKKKEYDIRSDIYHQVYAGYEKEDKLIETALEDTKGLVLYYKDRPASDVCYHSTCGGSTESNENVFLTKPVPYLRAVKCDFISLVEYLKKINKKKYEEIINKFSKDASVLCSSSKLYKWEAVLLKKYVAEKFPEVFKNTLGELINIVPVKYGASGRVVELKLEGKKKDYLVCGNSIRSVLNFQEDRANKSLYSTLFKIEKTTPSEFFLSGSGWGHGVGMCQFGAMKMAEIGITFEDILKYYYSGCEVKKIY